MPSKKRKSGTLEAEMKASKQRKLRAQDLELKRQWRPINLDQESFHLPASDLLDRHPTFALRRATLGGIFLKFVTPSLVTEMALNIEPANLVYDNGVVFSLTLQSIYRLLAIWIRIYGEQHHPKGVRRGQRPLRDQLHYYQRHFLSAFPNTPSLGLRFMEIMTTNFLFDSRYSKQLSHNFRMILRGIGSVIAGDEKLLHFTGIYNVDYKIEYSHFVTGDTPFARVVYMKPDRVGLWVYELCVRLANKTSYMLDLWLHDAVSLHGESIPVSKVVKHWGKVVHSFNAARMSDTILVFDSYYLDDAARVGLADKKVKFIGAVNPQRFPALTRMVRAGVTKKGRWKGLWNGVRKEVIVHSYTKDGKMYTALSNAYHRLATKSRTKSVPVCSDYGKMFSACDVFNRQIKNRIWPHKHGGRRHLGDMGKFSSFAFGCVLQNTFNAYCDINSIGRNEFDYYSLCEELASQLYAHANTLSQAIIS